MTPERPPSPAVARFAAPAALFAGALALRLAHYAEVRDTALFLSPVLDSRHYLLWAQQISGGSWLGEFAYVLNPGYAYFLAVLMKVFGPGVHVPALVQSLLGATTCVLVHQLAAKMFDARTALVAGSLAAAYPASILYDGLLVTACVILLLNTLALLLLHARGRRPWQCALAGAALGLSALFRPTVLAFLPFALYALARRGGRRHAAVLAAACFAVLLPVLARNYAIGRQVGLAAAGLGMNFFIGNNAGATGTYAPQPFESGDPRHQTEEFRQEASRLSGRILSAQEASAFWFRRAWEFILGDPVAFGALVVRKAALFVNRAEVPTNMDLSYLQGQSFLRLLPLLSFGSLFPLALYGMITARGTAVPLAKHYVTAYLLANVLFFVGSEYRYPAVATLFVFAGAATTSLLRVRSLRELARPACLLVVLGVACNVALYENDPAVTHNNLGNAYLRQGDTERAVAEYRKALEIDPAGVPARANLATVFFKRGEYVAAIGEFRRLLEVNPAFADAWFRLGLSYYYLGKPQEALPHFRRAVELKPDWREAREFVRLSEAAGTPVPGGGRGAGR